MGIIIRCVMNNKTDTFGYHYHLANKINNGLHLIRGLGVIFIKISLKSAF